MRVSEAKELFRSLTAEYFVGADVIFSRQSRIAKPLLPLVSITPGTVRRHLDPAYRYIDATPVGYYLTRINMEVDLFTHGAAVKDDDGNIVAYENTAMDDMLSYMDFLNSQYVIEWCHSNDAAISFDGDPQDLTGIVNDNNYEFRARLSVIFYFTQAAIGYAAVLSESSIMYATGETDEDGNPVYTDEEPYRQIWFPPVSESAESSTTSENSSAGSSEDTSENDSEDTTNSEESSSSETSDSEDTSEENSSSEGTEESSVTTEAGTAVIIPQFEQTSSGGGAESLAENEAYYFVEAEIEEDLPAAGGTSESLDADNDS